MSTKAEDTQKNILDTARKHFLKDGLTGIVKFRFLCYSEKNGCCSVCIVKHVAGMIFQKMKN